MEPGRDNTNEVLSLPMLQAHQTFVGTNKACGSDVHHSSTLPDRLLHIDRLCLGLWLSSKPMSVGVNCSAADRVKICPTESADEPADSMTWTMSRSNDCRWLSSTENSERMKLFLQYHEE